MNTLMRACVNVQNYRQQTNKVYGSHRLLTIDFPILRREIDREYLKLTGHRIDHSPVRISDGEIQNTWESVRKGWYKPRSNGKAVLSDRPLFGEVEGSCVVYAHTACIAKYDRVRVIKLGYTRQNIAEYIAGRRIAFDAKLLATMCGDERDEKRFLRKWRFRLADGNEWFWPEDDLLNWIPTAFDDLEPDFHALIDEARVLYRAFKRKL